VAELSQARVRLLVQGQGFVSEITDDLDRLDAPSQTHLVAEAGSEAIGVRGRVRLADGLTVLGGFSAGREDYQDITASSELTGTLAVRYAPTSFGPSRPFVEIGGLVGGTTNLTLQRHYLDGVKTVTGQGGAGYSNDAFWGRFGWIWDTSPANQLGLYGEYGEQHQSIGGYLEPLSNINPFEALVSPGTDSMGVGKIGLREDHAFKSGWEFSAGLAMAHAFSGRQLLAVDVDGFGPVAAPPLGEQSWLEYRARLGHRLTENSALSAFVAGVAGSSVAGDATHVGVDYRLTF
jgi:hypothetical protein